MMFRFFSEIVKGIFSASPRHWTVSTRNLSRRPQAYLVSDKKGKHCKAKKKNSNYRTRLLPHEFGEPYFIPPEGGGRGTVIPLPSDFLSTRVSIRYIKVVTLYIALFPDDNHGRSCPPPPFNFLVHD